MLNPNQILLLSEIFPSAEMLDSALHKLNFFVETKITGSSNEAKQAIERYNFSIVIIDSYVMRNFSTEWVKTLIHLNKGISFILISYDTNEQEIFQWLELGFSDIVIDSALELAIAIKREMRNLAKAQESQELEKKIRQSSQFLQLVLDHVPAGIFWKDKNSRYLGCNKLHANALHFSNSAEIIGKFDSDLNYSTAKLKLFREDDLKVIAENKKISRITSFDRGQNGNTIWTETNKVPIHDEYGNVIGTLGLYNDITKQMLLQKELREREYHYRTIIENLSEGVIIYDAEQNVTNCNSSAESITGFKLYELMDGAHKRSKTELLNENGQVIEKSQLPHFITKTTMASCSNVVVGFKYSENKIQWIRFNTVPIFDEQMNLSLIITTLVDITERKNAKDKMREIKENLSNIFSNTHICFVYLDTEFNFISVNEAYAKGTGHPPEYFIGKNHFELYPNEENEGIFKKVVETGETFTVYAKPFSFPDHTEWGITYWDWTLKPIKNIDGNIERLLFSLIDVTDNIKSQQKLQEKELLYTNIFSIMSEGIMVIDKNENIITCNPSAEKIINAKKNCDELRETFAIINEDLTEIPKEEHPVHITLKTGLACKNIILGVPLEEKEYKWLSVNTQPIFSENSKEVLQVVVSFTDITEKKKIERELLIKKKMEAIGNIASNIVHDFNNILQPIMLFASLLKSELSMLTKTEKIEKLIGFAEKIHKASTNGKNMIHQILKVSNKPTQVMQTVDLIKIIREIETEIEIIKPPNIKIQFSTSLESAKLTANEISIRQFIYNLCQNSLYAMKDTTNGILDIQLDRREGVKGITKEGNESIPQFTYEILVQDNGCGIGTEYLDRLFEPYFTTKQNDGGTGLGLTSVYSIIQTLKGNISVMSKEGVGTTFTIYLPIKDSLH